VTTAFAAGLGLLPFLILSNRPGLEIVNPMALVVIGGLITSTLLSLFVVPTLYLSFGRGPRPVTTAEDELMHRWAEAEPRAAGEPSEPAESQRIQQRGEE
jgi:predicted exporter